MLHQLIEAYKFTTTETADREVFTVHTDEGTTFTVRNAHDKLTCNCTFTIHYRLICSHMFNVANALQVKTITKMQHFLDFWVDDPNPEDPSSRHEIAKVKRMKKLGNIVDKLADKARLRRALFKGGKVPQRMHKVQVEYYKSDEEEDEEEGDDKNALRTGPKKYKVDMFDLMHKQGETIKGYTR